MSAWKEWPVPSPSPGFAERVAEEARRRHVTRNRTRRLAFGAAGVLAAAAVALLAVRGVRKPVPAIRADAVTVDARTIHWPSPAAWGDVHFDFPLPFAPELPYRGFVHMHMGPEFERPGTPGYWAYVVSWVTADGASTQPGELPDPRRLEQDLRTYYTGLCGKNGHPGTGQRAVDFVSREAHLSPVPLANEDRGTGASELLRGEVEALDCIVNGDELTLHVEASVGTCAPGVSYVAYALSPRPLEDPIWTTLRAERRTFDCRAR